MSTFVRRIDSVFNFLLRRSTSTKTQARERERERGGPTLGGDEVEGQVKVIGTVLYCTVLYCTVLYCTIG